jgi:hypothetical protein
MDGRATRTSTVLAVATLAALAGLAGCASAPPPPVPAAQAPPTAPAPPAPADVGTDELGHIPVLMYHRIVDEPVSVYDRTPADFRAELERLAGEDYVPVTAADLAAGRIDVPAGTHPVVLTFDDGSPTQFALGPPAAGSWGASRSGPAAPVPSGHVRRRSTPPSSPGPTPRRCRWPPPTA